MIGRGGSGAVGIHPKGDVRALGYIDQTAGLHLLISAPMTRIYADAPSSKFVSALSVERIRGRWLEDVEVANAKQISAPNHLHARHLNNAAHLDAARHGVEWNLVQGSRILHRSGGGHHPKR